MGATKSKPKELGQRSRSLDGTIGPCGGGGHHLSPGPQSLTPTRSPGRDGTRRGTQPLVSNAELALFGGVDHPGTITSPHRGQLAGTVPLE